MFAILRSTDIKVCGAMGLVLLATQVYAEEHAHKHAEHSAVHAFNQGKKWGTDEVLRQGMDNIRQVMVASQEGIEKERLSAQDYQRLAVTVDKNIAGVVKNCKLSKEADAAFHTIVLADLSQSAELMRTSPKLKVQRAGALGVLQALRNYGEYFQHSGWSVGLNKR